jgi:hypothetical protein
MIHCRPSSPLFLLFLVFFRTLEVARVTGLYPSLGVHVSTLHRKQLALASVSLFDRTNDASVGQTMTRLFVRLTIFW